MSKLIDMIRDADDVELLTALAARGARTVKLKSGKVRVVVTLAPGTKEADAPQRSSRSFVYHLDPDVRL